MTNAKQINLEENSYYLRLCQHCQHPSAQPFGVASGYYKCERCKKYTLTIITKRETYERGMEEK